MTVIQIQEQIDNILSAMVANPASDIIEYSVGDKTVKRKRQVLMDDLAFWREELSRALGRKRTIHTRF